MAIEHAAPAVARATRRRRVPWGLLVVVCIVGGAIAFLIFSSTRGTAQYYMTVPELHACTTCGNQTVRVAGFVADKSIQRLAGAQELRFTLADHGQTLPVAYAGIVPDTFKAGTQVVVEGRIQQGTFQAQTLLAKCPSKFQAATPGARP